METIKLTPACKDYLWGGEKLRQDYGIQVFPIVTVREIISFLHNREIDGKVYIDDEMKSKMEAYLAQYGAKA